MIVSKHRILQTYAVAYAPGKTSEDRIAEVARQFGLPAEAVAEAVADAMVNNVAEAT